MLENQQGVEQNLELDKLEQELLTINSRFGEIGVREGEICESNLEADIIESQGLNQEWLSNLSRKLEICRKIGEISRLISRLKTKQ